MNRTKLVGVVTLFLATIFGGWAWGGVDGSKHDFSQEAWAGGDVCGVCHTPESGGPPSAAPLWDEQADLNRTFGTPLDRSSRAGTGTTICLRCHDGSIARDTISPSPGERFVNKQNPGLFTSGHGTSEHPVGIDYPQFDRGYRPSTSVLASGTVSLPGGKVECISCHDPHDMSGFDSMLVTSNTRSALCLTCHRK